MTLSALIRKRGYEAVATATVAIPATHEGETVGIVAKIATIAIANPKEREPTPAPEPAQDPIGNHWKITLQSGRVIEVCQTPPQTRSWVITNWQALDATRLEDIRMAGPDR